MLETARRIVRGLRQIRQSLKAPFRGIHANWADVPRKGNAFDDRAWAQSAVAYSRCMIERDASAVPYEVTDEKALLPLLLALHPNSRVLDWGGATGFGYLAIQHATSLSPNYTVVETEAICDAGRELLPQVRFLTTIPYESFDIIVLGSALQYVEDWRDLITQLLQCAPRFVLFTKTPAGNVPTYITAQVNMPGKAHPHWMWYATEILSFMSSNGYRCIFSSACVGAINQDNFPPSHRIGQPANFLFEET